MLPDCRKGRDMFSIPKFTVKRKDIGSFMEELRAFHGEFGDCFLRKETKENFFRYMVGRFSELERKSIEPTALSVENSTVRDSVGVAKRYCGSLGKVENCQVGVFAACRS